MLTPEQRSERARNAGRAASAARAKRRAEQGLPPTTQRPASKPMPQPDELEPYLKEIDAEPRAVPLSYDARIREASLRLRRDVAQRTYDALKNDGER